MPDMQIFTPPQFKFCNIMDGASDAGCARFFTKKHLLHNADRIVLSCFIRN